MNGEPNEMKQLVPGAPIAAPPSQYYEHYTETPESGSQGLNLRDILVIVCKHKYKILSVFLLSIICAFIVHGMLPVRYEAKSVLMLRYGREYTTPSVGNDQAPLHIGLPEIMNSEVSILSSKDLKETVIREIGVDKFIPNANSKAAGPVDPVQVAILIMEKNLTVQAEKNANLISVVYKSEDPRLTADVVNSLINNYQDKRLQILNDSKPTLFLENKVATSYKRLRDSENKLESFKQANRVYVFEDQRTTLLHNRESLDADTSGCQMRMKELHEKLAVLEKEANKISKVVSDPSRPGTGDDAQGQLLTLKRKEQELLSKYKEGNPLIISTRQEMKVVEDFMANRKKDPTFSANNTSLELQRDIINTKAELASLEVRFTQEKQQLESLNKEIQELDLQENKVQDLRRELASNEQMYQTYSKRLEDARISDDMDLQKMTSISLVEKASAPIAPVSPTKPLGFFLLVSSIGGLGGGIVIAFLLESLGQGLLSPQKAEKRLDLPVLLVLPNMRI
ncbi:MAG: GumC family protein [Syntrophobacteraceae bacterium]